ncbi:MAG: 3-deoxy-8-phosphooctulonate synthase [Deltaproteobacteria bacterium]|jgi:2-dehydro-3-deoxyphosphooctonate aldolase (KDO 8-P synthase)|nr:3-deoxy-8-phosphooctulonate synthase [Deltaproteobacteria bacterium]
MSPTVTIDDVAIGGRGGLAVIAGPCVVESMETMRRTAGTLKEITARLGLGLVFKSSFDKANRSGARSGRGPGFENGLDVLARIKDEFRVPVISDVHECWQVEGASKVLSALQIPAFLARQTDLLIAAAESGLPVNVKKGQFMAPEDMALVADKMTGRPNFRGLCLCERGTTFGYHNLVVDMRSLAIMRQAGWPVVFDATHSVQLPSAGAGRSLGDRRFVPHLARAAVAVGVDGVFVETHPDPERALCDAANQWPLAGMEKLLSDLKAVHELVGKLADN